ncbi:hypothetical protein Cgig2_029723 [Carnegiea gigantea]|uniref:GBF-interacting protein 1 N-terminal domain-containing protein n=1 Tax=Carnegiea gigantea TaxID=171969 RepID=A0A9Q1QG27_9CARY|nr:hypothetical protein Cgig2_029723 [Carnegiea gigantea]
MSSGRVRGGGGGSNSNGGGVGSIPAASKKMVQSLKEIVNCPELEIYAMLREYPFHEVKSKCEKKKEIKDVSDSRPYGASSSSSPGGRVGVDRYSGHGSTAQYGASDSGALCGKPVYKRDNGPTAHTGPALAMTGNNVNRQQPPLSDSNMDKAFPAFTAENTSAAPASSGFQSACAGMPGQVSMADIVKMGRPHVKASGILNTSQQHVTNQHVVVSSAMPTRDDLHPSQNHSVKLSESNSDSGVTGSQYVPPNDGWHLEEEPPAANVSSIVEPSIDSEPCSDHYDRAKQQYRSQSDDVRFLKDDAGDNAHADLVRSVPGSNQNIQEENSGGVSGFDNHLYQDINSYHVDHREADGACGSVSSVTTDLQKLSLPKEDEDSVSEEDGPDVKIPDHLHVLSADCSHLSFGTFGSGVGAPFSGPLDSRPVKSDEQEVAATSDAPRPIGQPQTRYFQLFEAYHLSFIWRRTTADENTAHRMGANSDNFDATSVSQPDLLKQEAPEVAQENQYSFPSPATSYTFEKSQQLNTSFTHSQTSSQMQGVHCRCLLVADVGECFTKKPAEVLVAIYCYFEARIKGTSVVVFMEVSEQKPKSHLSHCVHNMANSSNVYTGGSKLVDSVIHLKNSTLGKSNRTHVLRRTEPEDIGHIPNGSRDDEFYHDESDGPQPYRCRGSGFPKSASLRPPSLSPFRKPLTLKGNYRIVNSNVQFSQPVSSANSSSLTSTPLFPSPSLSSMVCHKCYERGHPASRCPNHAFTIELDTLEDDDQIKETVYLVVGDMAIESEDEDDERESSYCHEIMWALGRGREA